MLHRRCWKASGSTVSDGGELPVLDLEHEDAAPWVQHDEVWIARLGPDRDVATAEVVVFEELFQPLGEAPLAGRIELALRANRKECAICTFLGSGPVQIVRRSGTVIERAVAARDGTLATASVWVKQTMD